MSKKSPQVTSGPARSGAGWEVRRGGNERASAKTETQKEAIKIGREIAIDQRAEHVIKGENGRIREKNSYGNDPNPPKDKK